MLVICESCGYEPEVAKFVLRLMRSLPRCEQACHGAPEIIKGSRSQNSSLKYESYYRNPTCPLDVGNRTLRGNWSCEACELLSDVTRFGQIPSGRASSRTALTAKRVHGTSRIRVT